jgi:hypothetical protein
MNAVEMDSVVMKNVPSFSKTGSRIQMLIGGGDTDRMEIPQAYFRKVG